MTATRKYHDKSGSRHPLTAAALIGTLRRSGTANLKCCTVLVCMVTGLMLAPHCHADAATRFTAKERAWIAAHPVVRTYADSQWRPFEFREDGKVVGIVPSYLDAISRISGLRFEYVDGVSWSNSYDALMSGRIDVAPNISSAASISRFQGHALLTRPYFVGTLFVIASNRMNIFADPKSLTGKRVAIKGGGGLEYSIRHSSPTVTVLTFDDERDALAAVADGRADVAVGTNISMLPLVQRQFPDTLFVVGGIADRPYALAMATRLDEPTLASILDKSLSAIPAREAEDIPDKWIEATDYGKPTLQSILHYRRPEAITAAAILLALSAIALVSWRLRVAAVRSERDKAIFLAFISHEIRTPMHTILSSLEMLQRSQLTPNQANRADAAVAASESLLTLLDDVLEYSRLESRNVTLVREPTAIAQWARRSVDMVRWRVDEKTLAMTLKLACPPDLRVLIDPVRTHQIVLNLLVNAIKFTSAGSVTLHIDYIEGKSPHTGSLMIEVHDTGIGIPAERQRRIFEPYQRVEQSGSRGASGSGLGLSICRELTNLMNGTITVSSNEEKGAIFTVILPAVRVREAATPPASRSTHARESIESDDRPLILIVDDHESVQHAIQQQLNALACDSTIAGTGEKALEQFERASFDMVLLDCNLPDIDGYTVARRIRDSERQRQRQHTPLIAISAATDDAHRERCLDSGMDGVLAKPLRFDVLRQMIDLWCPAEPAAPTESPASVVTTPVPQTAPLARPDFHAVYSRSVDADLVALHNALLDGDAERARFAAHRIKGAAAIAGHTATSELAAELEHRLQDAAAGNPTDIDALQDALLRRHHDDLSVIGTDVRESGGTRA